MRLHKFKSGGRWALTKDRTGRNLPDSKPAWAYMSAVEMKADDGPRIGASSADILAAVEKDGYAVMTVDIRITAKAVPRGPKRKQRPK
jgi:hypothetical protein